MRRSWERIRGDYAMFDLTRLGQTEHIKRAEQDFGLWLRGRLHDFPVFIDGVLVARSKTGREE